ncbi:MAG: RNA methyltransferase [Candidatus Micrarchaeota archaeon]|nr:RNA methyltransferase [Candidatus Micrarchaeota archaeon]MDE1824137.1 RNA methyltransferase [Candidatus Micrarchaeota archaeon]MDE1849910.1 RNA methyltransferase [Candidatus Micrarchaeota archaeon]
MELKVIVVEPKYQMNLGYIARVSKNFGIKRLFLVRPRAKVNGRSSVKFAKHARDLLEGAKVYGSIDEAARDCDMIIGTTGIWRKAGRTFSRISLLEDALKRINRIKGSKRAALIIGRDDTGLSSEEIEMCDIVAYIGTDDGYPILNISHALAIMLYELTRQKFSLAYKDLSNRRSSSKELRYLFKTFGKNMEGKRVRDKRAVMNAFKRIIHLSQPNDQEIHALITALK